MRLKANYKERSRERHALLIALQTTLAASQLDWHDKATAVAELLQHCLGTLRIIAKG